MKSSSRAALAALCVVLATQSIAFAEPTAADKATARDLFTEGKALRAKGDHAGALSKFEGAYALVASPITAYELARERVAVGQLIEARELLLEIARMPPKLNESAEASKARSEAVTLANELKPRIPTITIKLVTKLPAVTITIDGAQVPAGTLSAPRRANPGKHVVVARATGAPDRVVDVELGESETREIEVRIDVDEPAPKPAVAVPIDSEGESAGVLTARRPIAIAPHPTPPSDDAHTGRTQRIAAISVGALGFIGLGVGAVVGLSARSKWADSAAHCPNDLCDPEGAGLADDARSLGRTSRLVLGIGAAAVVAGVVLYVTAPSSKSATTVSLSPTGLTLRASF